jgi:ankyrin repeat protein
MVTMTKYEYAIYMDGIDCDSCYFYHALTSYEDNIQERNDIMEYLIQQGATLSCKDDSGRTPLEHAMMTYRTSSTFILLKYGGRISGDILTMSISAPCEINKETTSG